MTRTFLSKLSPALLPAAALVVAGFAQTAHAQIIQSGDGSVVGSLCVGINCTSAEFSTDTVTMRLKQNNNKIEIDDTSTQAGIPDNDWELQFNDLSDAYFALRDVTNSQDVFRIEAGAGNNALFVSQSGDIGLGTMLPEDALHIVKPGQLSMILERTGSGAGKWKFGLSNVGVFVREENTAQVPFRLYNNAPTGSLIVQSDGDVGLGEGLPEGKLHTKGNGTQLVYFESGDGGAVQMRFRSDSQNRRFLAVNNSNQVQTQMQFRDNEILFLGQTNNDEWLRVDATGITTAGPTCNPNPCDRTFDPTYFEIQPIEERAAYMWENMHLPAVGPTAPGKPFNLTEKTAGILHELEVAHIYIEQLHARQQTQEREKADLVAQVSAQEARLTTLEAALQKVLSE